ncbi:hypothetical protein BKA81DRAFT_91046 [Phyllosticta paracitricarpa]
MGRLRPRWNWSSSMSKRAPTRPKPSRTQTGRCSWMWSPRTASLRFSISTHPSTAAKCCPSSKHASSLKAGVSSLSSPNPSHQTSKHTHKDRLCSPFAPPKRASGPAFSRRRLQHLRIGTAALRRQSRLRHRLRRRTAARSMRHGRAPQTRLGQEQRRRCRCQSGDVSRDADERFHHCRYYAARSRRQFERKPRRRLCCPGRDGLGRGRRRRRPDCPHEHHRSGQQAP